MPPSSGKRPTASDTTYAPESKVYRSAVRAGEQGRASPGAVIFRKHLWQGGEQELKGDDWQWPT
jgi:septum formation inhibitor MinC